MAAAAAAAKAKPPARAMAKSRAGAPPKNAYRPPTTKSGIVKPATARQVAGSSVPPPGVAAAASSASAVATAAAAAKAAATGAAAIKSSQTQTKPSPKLVSKPAAKPPATSTKLPSTEATSAVRNKHPDVSASSSKVPVIGSTASASGLKPPLIQTKKDIEASAVASAQATGKPSQCVQPRIVTNESAAKEASVVTAQSAATGNVESEKDSVETNGNSEAESTVEGTVNASIKKEHASDDDHDTEKCPDICCQEARAVASGDVMTSINDTMTELVERNALEQKSKSSDSAELSRSSSCSDEVQKKEDVVRISSC